MCLGASNQTPSVVMHISCGQYQTCIIKNMSMFNEIKYSDCQGVSGTSNCNNYLHFQQQKDIYCGSCVQLLMRTISST